MRKAGKVDRSDFTDRLIIDGSGHKDQSPAEFLKVRRISLAEDFEGGFFHFTRESGLVGAVREPPLHQLGNAAVVFPFCQQGCINGVINA
jgi:hypothetical protein